MVDGSISNNLDKLFFRASGKGYEMGPIISMIYYPSSTARGNIKANFSGNLEDEIKEVEGSLILPERILIKKSNNLAIDGKFVVYREGNSIYGNLNIKKLNDSSRPYINTYLFSEKALFPHRHNIALFNEEKGEARINTFDEDGSRWLIHCEILRMEEEKL